MKFDNKSDCVIVSVENRYTRTKSGIFELKSKGTAETVVQSFIKACLTRESTKIGLN